MTARLLATVVALLGLSMAVAAAPGAQGGPPPGKGNEAEPGRPDVAVLEQSQRPRRFAPCVQGSAAGFPCHRIDLLSYFLMEEIGGGQEVGTGRGSDVWGWEDPATGRAYVLAGRENGTAIVDITDPKRPVYLANLPTAAPPSDTDRIWRDIKVYADHAYVVAEGGPPSFQHGMQVLDLTRLRGIDPAEAPVDLIEDVLYKEFETAHNIAINEETGFAYAVGARNLDRTLNCDGGLHMIDIRDPKNPTFAGCFAEDGYIHDTQCVVYRGADARYVGREICFAASPTPGPSSHSVVIADVTDKSNPVMLSNTEYEGAGFSHQGWLTPDQSYLIFGDEGDERAFGHNTKTYVFDVRSLTDPALIGTHFGPTPAINHNIYTKNRWVYQSNYSAGLRILDAREVGDGELEEVAYFDTYPPHDEAVFGFGTWSNYPYFSSGVVAVHGYQGLWIVKPRLGQQKP